MSAVNPETVSEETPLEHALLLEIGTEEIPARFLPPAIADLRNIASALFAEHRIPYKEIRSYATPRRLVLMMKGVSAVQNDAVRQGISP